MTWSSWCWTTLLSVLGSYLVGWTVGYCQRKKNIYTWFKKQTNKQTCEPPVYKCRHVVFKRYDRIIHFQLVLTLLLVWRKTATTTVNETKWTKVRVNFYRRLILVVLSFVVVFFFLNQRDIIYRVASLLGSEASFSLLDHQKLHLRLTICHSSGVGRYSTASVRRVIFCDSGHVSSCFQNGIRPLCFLPRWITEWCDGCLFSVTLWRALVGHSKWSLAYCRSPDTSLGN